MRVLPAVLLVAFLFTAFHTAHTAYAQTCGYTSGDWLVNGTILCSGETIVLNGNLLVNESGDLRLVDSVIRFNSSFDGEFGLESNGSLSIANSAIEKASSYAYTFVSGTGAKLEINDSEIAGCGFNSAGIGKKGVYVKSDGTVIENTTFTGCYFPLIVYSSNNSITGNRMFSSHAGFDARGSNNLVTGNTIKGNSDSIIYTVFISGECVAFINNSLENNSASGPSQMRINYSIVSDNSFINNSDGLAVYGANNNITGNTIASGTTHTPGLGILNSENTLVSGNSILYGYYGLYVENSKNTVVRNSVFNMSNVYDIYLISAYDTTLTNTNFTTMTRMWKLNINVYDNTSAPVSGADVSIKNSYNSMIFSGTTNSQGMITQQLLEDAKWNESGVFAFSPYFVNVTKSGYYANSATFNLTGDLSLNVTLVSSPSQNLTFSFTIESPLNTTYIKYNLTNGSILLAVVSDKSISSCNYTYGNLTAPIFFNTSKRFLAYMNVSGVDKSYRISFVCMSADGLTNSSEAYFTVYPSNECTVPSDCGNIQTCINWGCVNLQCGECGYPSNHKCVNYECCSDASCAGNETCDIVKHECAPVPCGCTEKIANHRCTIEQGYCCNDLQCSDNEACHSHACVERTLSFSIGNDTAVGRNITIKVIDQDGNIVPDAGIDVKYSQPDPPVINTYYTDSGGNAVIEIKYAGKVEFVARKAGYFTTSKSFEVPEPFNMLFTVEIVVLVISLAGISFIAFRYVRKGGLFLGKGPFMLEKTVSLDHVMLKIRNKTKKLVRDVTIRDSVPRDAFLRARIMPKIENLDGRNDLLIWEILELNAGEEVDIEYEARATNRGFSVRLGDKEYSA